MLGPFMIIGAIYICSAAIGLCAIEDKKLHLRADRHVIIDVVLGLGHLGVGVITGA